MKFFLWNICTLLVITVVDTYAFITQISTISSRQLNILERNEHRLNNVDKNKDEDISLSSSFTTSSSVVTLPTLDINVDKSSVKNRKFGSKWAKDRGMEPGYGGIWPGDPNAPKFNVKIVSKRTGQSFECKVPSDRYIYFYFEEMGIELPVVNRERMCRQGCCTICTGKIVNEISQGVRGKVKQDAPLGLLKDFREKGYCLTCATYPRSDLILELQDEDETFIKQWSEGFEGGGVEWGGVFMDED